MSLPLPPSRRDDRSVLKHKGMISVCKRNEMTCGPAGWFDRLCMSYGETQWVDCSMFLLLRGVELGGLPNFNSHPRSTHIIVKQFTIIMHHTLVNVHTERSLVQKGEHLCTGGAHDPFPCSHAGYPCSMVHVGMWLASHRHRLQQSCCHVLGLPTGSGMAFQASKNTKRGFHSPS